MAKEDTIVSGMAQRYASALHALAAEQGSTLATAEALKKFQALMADSADLQRLVKSPAFSADDQTRALTAVLDRAHIGGLAAQFLKLVASKRRLFAISDMIAGYMQIEDSANGVVRAEATVADPLTEEQAQALRQRLASASGGKTIEVAVRVDPSIVGGIVVKLGSRMIDASLKTKLNAIRTRMKEVG